MVTLLSVLSKVDNTPGMLEEVKEPVDQSILASLQMLPAKVSWMR